MDIILYFLISAFFIVLGIKIVIVGLEFMYKYAFTIFTLVLLFALLA